MEYVLSIDLFSINNKKLYPKYASEKFLFYFKTLHRGYITCVLKVYFNYLLFKYEYLNYIFILYRRLFN